MSAPSGKHKEDSESGSDDEARHNEGGEGGEEAPIEAPEAEKLPEKRKGLLLSLISNLKIGMDLSKVPLPTFVLEPRSLLEKLTDFLTHVDFLLQTPEIDDPLERLIGLTRWYLSGWYIRPKGVKKPYNPILGETFRCKYAHTNSETFYVAEQVSHHPPVSAFYVTNRKAGIVLMGSAHPRSRFLGNSAAAILDGTAHLHLLKRDEEYTFTFPTAYARGILFGTLVMEFGSTVHIKCEKTGYRAEIDFKTKPLLGGSYNNLGGKIIQGKKTVLYTISGKWDSQIFIKKKAKSSSYFSYFGGGSSDQEQRLLFDTKGMVPVQKIVRPNEEQDEWESRRLWQRVTKAILADDQNEAAEGKGVLEDRQREDAKKRKEEGAEWVPKLFEFKDEKWVYKWANIAYTPEVEEEEKDGVIRTKGQ